MWTRLQATAAVLIVLLAVGCSKQQTSEASADLQRQISDAAITSSIKTAYALNDQVSAFDINVDTDGGVVTLRGEVESASEMDLAEKIARSTKEVKEVKNELVVTPEPRKRTEPAGGEKSYRQSVKDASVTAAIKSRFAWDRDVSADTIDVDTQSGVVTLAGSVQSEVAKKRAVKIAAETAGVREVRDQLQVTPAAPGQIGASSAASKVAAGARKSGEVIAAASQQLGERLSDAWITAKVKSALALNKYLSAADINVDSQNGEVTLRGIVHSQFAKREAEIVASSTRGVTKVHNLLKYTVD